MAIEASRYDQPAIARHLNISQQTVSSWVTGRTEPKFDKLCELCLLLRTTPNWILSFDEPIKSPDEPIISEKKREAPAKKTSH